MSTEFDDDDRDEPMDEREDRDERIIERAKEKIKAPAIVLLVVGCISLVLSLISVANVFTMDGEFAQVEEQWDNDPKLKPEQKKDMKQMLATYKGAIKVGLPISIAFCIITAVITILGSVKIMNLSGKGLGVAGSVLSMIPFFSGCCCMGLPVGIWVIIALGKPEVKAGFAAVARATRRQSAGEY